MNELIDFIRDLFLFSPFVLIVLICWFVLIILLIIVIVFREHFFGSDLTHFHNSFSEFYNALVNLIFDFTFKFFLTIKNIFFFPIGIDYRLFQGKFKKVENKNGKAQLTEITNETPISPKANYYLLCFTVWFVSAYVYWALRSSFEKIYSNDAKNIKVFLPIVMSIVVFVLDVWIIRSYAFVKSNGLIRKRVLITSLRLTVSFFVAGIASFHILATEFYTDISSEVHRISLENITKGVAYKNLIDARMDLAISEYNSDGNKFCLNILSTGRPKNDDSLLYSNNNFYAIYEKYLLPTEQKNINIKVEVPIPIINCANIVTINEKKCIPAWADKKACPRLSEKAREFFLKDIQTFGLEETLKRGWFGVEKSYPELTTQKTIGRSKKEIFETSKNNLFPVKDNSFLGADVKVAVKVIIREIEDLNLIALFFILSPVFIFFIFEFMIIIVKSIWESPVTDAYMRHLEDESRNMIINNSSLSKIQQVHLELSSEFQIHEHICIVISTFAKMFEPLTKNKFIASFMIVILFIFITFPALKEIEGFFNLITTGSVKKISNEVLMENKNSIPSKEKPNIHSSGREGV